MNNKYLNTIFTNINKIEFLALNIGKYTIYGKISVLVNRKIEVITKY